MDSNKLKGKMREKNYTQKTMAIKLGITQQSFNAKINKRTQFTLNEVVEIVRILDIDNPVAIFFEKNIPKMQQE